MYIIYIDSMGLILGKIFVLKGRGKRRVNRLGKEVNYYIIKRKINEMEKKV